MNTALGGFTRSQGLRRVLGIRVLVRWAWHQLDGAGRAFREDHTPSGSLTAMLVEMR